MAGKRLLLKIAASTNTLTLAVHLDLRISLRIFRKKIQMVLMELSGAKNRKKKNLALLSLRGMDLDSAS